MLGTLGLLRKRLTLLAVAACAFSFVATLLFLPAWSEQGKATAGNDSKSAILAGTELGKANADLRKRIEQAAGIVKTLDQRAKLTKQTVPLAGSILEPFNGLLMAKPPKHDGIYGGLFWRLSAVHWQLGQAGKQPPKSASPASTGGLPVDPVASAQVQAVKILALTGKIHDDILKVKKSADEGLGKAAKTLWGRNEKPASIALEGFHKEAVVGLKKAADLLEGGLKAYGLAQQKGLNGLTLQAEDKPAAGGRKAKEAGEGKGGSSKESTPASAIASSRDLSGRGGNAPDPAATKRRAELALKRHMPGKGASPLTPAINSAPRGILAAAAAEPKFNCKEEDKVVEEICLPPFNKVCRGQFPCTVEANVIYTECRTRCGQDICTNTTERMGLFRICENAWRKEYARCLKLPDGLQDACHMANEDVSQSCIKKSGPNCKPKAVACTGDKVPDGKGGCISCPNGQAPNAEKTKCVPKPPTCVGGQVPSKDGKSCVKGCPDGKTPRDAKGLCPCGKQSYDPGKSCCSAADNKLFSGMVSVAGGRCGCPDGQAPKTGGGCEDTQQTKDKKLQAIRQKIAQTAFKYRDSRVWSKTKKRSNIGGGKNKCSLFVAEIAREGGAQVPNIHGRNKQYAPVAGDWADSNVDIPGWTVVKEPKPGDVAAIGIIPWLGSWLDSLIGPWLGSTGHVGIVLENGKTVSATRGKVVVNNWGFRPGQNPTFRRYTGEKK